jgi:hypothetical protein
LYENSATTNRLNRLAGIQVDDTFMKGSQAFRDPETKMHARFELSSTEEGAILPYSGVSIMQFPERREVSISQETYVRKTLADPLTIDSFTDIQSVCCKLAWLENVSRPDIYVLVAALLQITEK